MTCSTICETALGIIVPSPWKNPRITPSTATIKSVGASTRSANTQKGVFNISAKKSAKKNTASPASAPLRTAKPRAALNTR